MMDAESARAAAARAVARARAAGTGTDDAARVLGSALTDLGTSLARLGRTDEALAAHAEAVEVFHTLAARTGAVADRGNLAAALDNLGNRLADGGRPADACAAAQAGVDLRRPLARDDPEYSGDLARSLNNLGGRLAELGRPDAAQVLAEAVAIYRATPGARDEHWAFELGACLFNAAAVAAEAGDLGSARTDAAEAEALLRPLAEADPARFAGYHAQVTALLAEQPPVGPAPSGTDEERAFTLYLAADARREAAIPTQDVAGLDAAIGLMEQAGRLVPPGHVYAVAMAGDLCTLHRMRFEWTGDAAALERSIAAGEDAVRAGAGHPALGLLRSNLGIALRVRYEVTGDTDALDRAVACGRQAVATLGPGHDDLPLARANLAAALRARADLDRDTGPLAEAAAHYEGCLAALPADHPRRGPVTGDLAMTVYTRFELTGDPADADRAKTLSRAALDLMPPGHPDRGLHLTNAAIIGATAAHPADLTALTERALTAGRDEDLDAAIAAARAQLEPLVAYHPQRAGLLLRLSTLLESKASRTADRETAREAVQNARLVLRMPGLTADGRAAAQACLAGALNRWFYISGDEAALDEAVAAARDAAAAGADEHLRGGATQTLAMVLRARAMSRGGQDDLDEAIRLGRANPRTAGGPAEAMPTAAAVADLAHALLIAYQRTGDLAHLDEAISRLSRSLRDDTTATPREVAGNAALFGGLLRHRFQVRGDLADLNAAVEITEWARRSDALAGGARADAANQHALAVTARLAETRDPADATAAVDAARQACAALPEHNPDGRVVRLMLATSLHNRYLVTAALTDLAEAADVAADALALVPAAHPARSRYLHAMAWIRFQLYEATGERPDLAAALAGAEEAVGAAADGDPYLGRYLIDMADMYARTGRPADALDLLDRAAALPGVPAGERADAAIAAAGLAAVHAEWHRARACYGRAVALLPLLTWRGLHRAAREDQLVRRSGWAADAAAAALHAADPRHAVELTEHGRNVLWDQARQISPHLDALRAEHPDLAGRAERIRADLDSATRTTAPWSAETDALVGLVRKAER
ncbi:tetratricopeptide repeat protein [Dactylosporangium sp. NPDC051541]|uniref:tetratricopeptide repeat protein n=1 Tax=Dactylosporangium sp. NPDC051541 TaxID=3363977 RepID=UPI0037A6E69F